ncbi:MAG TPA: hypothetical protein VFN56_04700 [Candidatus Saccharimonadales bacterium]|nr:hypothetical protein [Candidatus Saccharimonadales bacterium]
MNKLIVASIVSGVTLAGAGIGLVNADTSLTANTSSNTSASAKIPHYTVESERLNAVAQVFNTTPTQLEDTLKTQTMQQVIQSAGLTSSSFQQKVKTQLQSDLEAQGYSQAQVDAVMSHVGMHGKGMRHHMDSDTNASGTPTNS